MSKNEFKRFRKLVFIDLSLQSRLSRESDRDLFIDNLIKIGAEYGFKFTIEDIKKEMARSRRCGMKDKLKLTPENFRNWIPVRLYWHEQKTFIDWCYMGDRRFTDPFFEVTIGKQLREPFSLLFRHQTSLEDLKGLYEYFPRIQPTGFIFHLSRCGSTLISQMLAALAENIVISEAPAIDFIIRNQYEQHAVSRDERISNLKCLINVYGQKRFKEEKHYFIKFDCWHTIDLALISEAFPDVPWIFLYRNPIEVIVSHIRQPGMQMIPGTIKNLLPDVNFDNILQMPREEYYARILAQICKKALIYTDSPNALLINYNQLPQALFSGIFEHFKINYSLENIEKMKVVTQFDAKTPQLSFVSDADSKNKQASKAIRQAAKKFVAPYYSQLEDLRIKSDRK